MGINMETNIKLMVVMTKLNQAFMNNLGKNLESLGMQASMYTMLAHLNDVGRAKTQKLGTVALISSGTITHTVNKMIAKDLVIKVQDENDKRIFWIEITEYGRKCFMDVHKEHIIYLNDLLSGFTEGEKLSFIEQIKYFGKEIEKRKE